MFKMAERQRDGEKKRDRESDRERLKTSLWPEFSIQDRTCGQVGKGRAWCE